MANVVISYKREDRKRVSIIAAQLRALRVSVWFDVDSQSGISYHTQIGKELEKCACVLVCWSPGALASEWVRSEADIGHKGQKLAACLLEPTPELEFTPLFGVLQAVDLSRWQGDGGDAQWLRLLARVGDLIQRPWLAEWARALHAQNTETLATLKAQHPQDPLAQDFWHENPTPEYTRPAAPKPKSRKSALLIAAGLIAISALGVLITRMLGPQPSSTVNLSLESAANEAAAHAEKQASRARGAAKDAYETATLADAEIKKAGSLAKSLALGTEERRKLCRSDTALDVVVAKSVPSPSEGKSLVMIACENSTEFLGQLQLSSGDGLGVLKVTSRETGAVTYTYSGEFRGFRGGGSGVDAQFEGWAFEGDFKDGLAHGYGVFKKATDNFKGEVRNHKKHGKGVEELNGVKLTGQFCNDDHKVGECTAEPVLTPVDKLPPS
jgi:hypothetical protein